MDLKLQMIEDKVGSTLPFTKKYVSNVLRNYLFEGKSAANIDQEFYSDEYSTTGILASTVLNSFGLISNTGSFDNKGIYKDNSLKEVIEFLNSQSDERYRKIAAALDEGNIVAVPDYTEEELGKLLEERYNKADGSNNKMLVLHLFGIEYSELIKRKKYSYKKIIECANILKSSVYVELRKGVKIGQYASLDESPETIDFEDFEDEVIDDSERTTGGYNKIYYGAPGTGKSWEIDNIVLKDWTEDERKNFVIRTTFHPEYTYNDFVGQLVPIVKKGKAGEKDEITYDFKKGPFAKAIEIAYENKNKMVYLIIEEMSRGNCAAIFGDIFQLLDREPDGKSTYPINNEIIAKDIDEISDNEVRIPSNLTILGTVNTSDQNVYVMDTAFKRRFEWKYIAITPDAKYEDGKFKNNVLIELNDGEKTTSYQWINFYMALNKFIASSDYLDLGEDKQIGQFFIKFESDEKKNREKIENKLLNYLWIDIKESSFKSDINLFRQDIVDFRDLFVKYEEDEQIFSDKFFDVLNSTDLGE